jgi:hypothetical protein
MSPEEREFIHQAAIEATKRSRAEQGLPEFVTDPAVLEQIATLMRGSGDRRDD